MRRAPRKSSRALLKMMPDRPTGRQADQGCQIHGVLLIISSSSCPSRCILPRPPRSHCWIFSPLPLILSMVPSARVRSFASPRQTVVNLAVMSGLVMKARKELDVKYPNLYATPGYHKNADEFNRIQRGHQKSVSVAQAILFYFDHR